MRQIFIYDFDNHACAGWAERLCGVRFGAGCTTIDRGQPADRGRLGATIDCTKRQ
jgi:hypothetical protein